jgi:hypothetical protein
MAIPSRQIGWGTDSNLLWQISKQLEYLTKVTGTASDVTVINDITDPVPVSPIPNNTGANGTTAYKLISLATTNANVVKASGGNLYSIIAIGLTSSVRYLKLYNKATAPNPATDASLLLMTIPVPANTQGAGIAIPFSMGVNFSAGIGIAITSGAGESDAGPVLANDVIVNLTYA